MAGYSTTIKPREPFFLFVPALTDIPADVRKQHKGEWFALGEFFHSKAGAEQKVKEAGYDAKQKKILAQQKYFGFVNQ